MPIVDTEAGTIQIRDASQIATSIVAAGSSSNRFGFGVLNPANPIREVLEAFALMPMDTLEQDMVNLFGLFDPRSNSGLAQEASLWPLFERLQASVATGFVNLNYDEIPTAPTPLWSVGDLSFFDGAGVRYNQSDDVDPPTTIHNSSAQTGTASETIGSSNSKIAQKVAIGALDYPQLVRFKATVVSSVPVVKVRIETDSGGSPSGTLVDTLLEKLGTTINNGTDTDVVIAKGAVIPEDDYWVVLEVTGGTVTFDGGVGGAANQVKYYSGSWAASAVENMNFRLYNGGRVPVTATQTGTRGNIAAGAIGAVQFGNGTAQTLFGSIVSTFENFEAFEGGKDKEDANEMRSRAKLARSARGTSSPGGLLAGMLNGAVDGVTFVDIKENDSNDWTLEDILLDNVAVTGDATEAIDATNTRIAHRFTTTDYRSFSSLTFKLATNNSLVVDVKVQTDAAGSPSGTLASPNFTATGVTPTGTTRKTVTFDSGDFLAAGTYWVIFERTAGDGTFDGEVDGADDNVKYYDGAWNVAATVENLSVQLYGGLPPHSFRLFVEGGSDDDVAQGIYGLRAPGIYADGPETGTAKDAANRDVSQRFSRITEVAVVMKATIVVDSSLFVSTEEDLQDALVEYVDEIGIGKILYRQEAMARIQENPAIVGVLDTTLFRLGLKVDFPSPASLTSGEVLNLTAGFGERFRIAIQASDIEITAVDENGNSVF